MQICVQEIRKQGSKCLVNQRFIAYKIKAKELSMMSFTEIIILNLNPSK